MKSRKLIFVITLALVLALSSVRATAQVQYGFTPVSGSTVPSSCTAFSDTPLFWKYSSPQGLYQCVSGTYQPMAGAGSSGSITPSADFTYNIGGASLRYIHIYADAVNGTTLADVANNAKVVTWTGLGPSITNWNVFVNANTGAGPQWQAAGTDTNVGLAVVPKGTGGVAVRGPLTNQTNNFIATETGANNAIAGTLADGAGVNVPLTTGLVVTVQLAHSLQAGANTFAYNGGSALGIKSRFNTANNIATAYAATGMIVLAYNGTLWVDQGQ